MTKNTPFRDTVRRVKKVRVRGKGKGFFFFLTPYYGVCGIESSVFSLQCEMLVVSKYPLKKRVSTSFIQIGSKYH